MGQSWSSDSKHIEGFEPIREMIASLPSSSSRESLQLDATKKYPNAGEQMIRRLLSGEATCGQKTELAPATNTTDSSNIGGLIRRHAGIILVKDLEEHVNLVARAVETACRRILPDYECDDLVRCIVKCLVEPLHTSHATYSLAECYVTTGVRRRSARADAPDICFKVRIVLSKELLDNVTDGLDTLLGVALIFEGGLITPDDATEDLSSTLRYYDTDRRVTAQQSSWYQPRSMQSGHANDSFAGTTNPGQNNNTTTGSADNRAVDNSSSGQDRVRHAGAALLLAAASVIDASPDADNNTADAIAADTSAAADTAPLDDDDSEATVSCTFEYQERLVPTNLENEASDSDSSSPLSSLSATPPPPEALSGE